MSAASLEQFLVHVAQRNDFDRRDLDEAEEIALPVPARADETDAFGFLVYQLQAFHP